MKILKVNIKNLNSLRMVTEIDFSKAPIANSGLFAITGDTGAGKTTILDAITLALYGKVHRNKDVKEVISYGAADCFAEIEFEAKGEIYRGRWELWRARGKAAGKIQGPKRELSQWNSEKTVFEIIAEKIAEVNQEVEKITGLDYDRFSRSVMLSQGDFAAFLKSGEKERSDLLERITGTEVYSQLSKAAFQRHKIEEAKLGDLKKELESLRILDEEELKTFNAELKALESNGKTVKKSLDEAQQKLNWLEKIEELEKKQIEGDKVLSGLERERKEAVEEFQLLELHKKTLPFHTSLSKLDDWIENNKRTHEEVSELTQKLVEIKLKEAATQTNLSQVQKILSELKAENEQKAPLYDTVLKLDVLIKEKKAPLIKLQTSLKESEEQKGKEVDGLKSTQSNLEKSEQEFQSIREWLKSNKELQQLHEDLPTIRLHYSTLREIWQNEQEQKKQLKSIHKELELAIKAKEKSQKVLNETEKQHQQVQNTFSEKVPEEFALSRSELLNKLSEEIEKLNLHNKNLQQLKIFNDEYQSLMIELSGYEDQLASFRNEELDINNRVMTSLDAMDRISEQLEFKQQVYEQQRMIANYETDRNELEEGEPCPLCFSKTHPFREKSFKPFVDNAKKELDQVKSQYDIFYQEHRKLLNRQNDLETQIEAITGNELKSLSGQVNKQFEKLLEYEERISLIAPELSKADFSLTRKSLLNLKIADFESKVEERRKTRELLITMDSKLEKLEKSKQTLQSRIKDEELAIVRIEEKLNLNQEKQKDAQKRFNASTDILNKLLKSYDLTFEVETGKQTLEKLESQKIYFDQYTTKENTLKNQIDLYKQELNQIKQTVEKLEKSIEQINNEIAKDSASLKELIQQRQELFGDKDPEEEKKRLQLSIENTAKELELSKTAWNETNVLLKTTQHSISERNNQLEQSQEKISQLQENLEGKLLTAGFANLEQLRKSILEEAKATEILQKSERLKEKEVEIRQSLKTIEKDLNTEKAKKLTEDDKSLLQDLIRTTESKFQELQQGIGALKEKLDQNDKRKAESKALLKNIENQRKEYNRWAKLNDIIGMADGKKFRVFAQGLTLKKLASLANNHLQLLNGRYFIHKRSDEDLALDIIDTFQADNIRSMNTLSGGESFLVSLALALGLSDLAGRNTTINSLFIDEGFGTLDESTLDLAISTLENLQSKGKTIGIISHVKELKERISTQILVKKKASGFSEIEILG